jgi:hypothetical protein
MARKMADVESTILLSWVGPGMGNLVRPRSIYRDPEIGFDLFLAVTAVAGEGSCSVLGSTFALFTRQFLKLWRRLSSPDR